MNQRTIQVREKTPQTTILRFLDANGDLIDDRELDKAEVNAWVDEVETHYQKASPELDVIGRRLYDWLDGPDHRWLAKAFTDSQPLALRIDAAERLRHLPWELLQHDGAFLCTNALRPFCPVRFVNTTARTVERANRPLRVLFMACSPIDVEPVLDFEKEERLILKATQKQPIELVVEESGSLIGLEERIQSLDAGHYDVLHLSGHADVKDGTPIFHMENDLGFNEPATAEDIAHAFDGNWPRLLFLSGCKTGQAVDRGALPSLCEALVQTGAPAVLGWALPVYDETANRAASVLYGQLAVAKSIDHAVAHARAELVKENAPDWHLLRLYADATPLSELVTPIRTKGRKRLKAREAASVFLDAGAKMEVCPRTLFVGRRRAIQRCLRVLHANQGEDAYAEGVLLHGMGGLGKSSLAARLCERLPGHPRLVCVGALDEMELRKVLSDRLKSADVITILNTEGLELGHKLYQILAGPLAEEPVLFVFDDFEQNIEMNSDGCPILKPDARDILTALLGAIRDAASESRAIVTSRYTFSLSGPAGLYEEGLESMRGPELDKKTALLPKFEGKDAAPKKLRNKALALADGNPRLLDRLNKVLADADTDHTAVLTAMEQAEAEFRENVLLEQLLKQLPSECRKTIAHLALIHVPVDETTVAVTADKEDVSPELQRATALSLVESGKLPGESTRVYYVSRIVAPFLKDTLTDDQRTEARRRAAQHLYQVWWVGGDGASEAQMIEIHRLAMLSEEGAIAAAIARAVARNWINRNRYREAERLCAVTLRIIEDYRVLHNLGRAEVVLGKTQEARRHYERALELCPALTESTEREVKKERGGILYNLAGLLVQFGEVDDAMALYEESGQIDEELDDVKGKAATLHQMAGVIAQQGDVQRALDLWKQSLELLERIGDVQGKAATLANMAWLAGQQGDEARKRALNIEAARALAEVGAWLDCVTVLGNLGASDDADAQGFLTQALWLCLRVHAPVDNAAMVAAALSQKVGPESDTAPLIATWAMFLTQTRGEDHPQKEQLVKLALAMLGASAQARNVPEDEFMDWMANEKLNDPEYFIPALNAALEALVPGEAWLFDRTRVGE